jgi:hypothetical protein
MCEGENMKQPNSRETILLCIIGALLGNISGRSFKEQGEYFTRDQRLH